MRPLLENQTPLGSNMSRPIGEIGQSHGGSTAGYEALCTQLGGMGALDTGLLGPIQDLKQRTLAVTLATNVLNVRNQDLRRLINSLSD